MLATEGEFLSEVGKVQLNSWYTREWLVCIVAIHHQLVVHTILELTRTALIID